MQVHRAHVYRLYPTPEQLTLLARTAGVVRLVYLYGEPGQLRVCLMTPERAAYLALEAALRARGPLGLNDLLSEARRRGLGKGPLPYRGSSGRFRRGRTCSG